VSPPIALLTGFPGFIGERLLPRLLARHEDIQVACLVQPRFERQARETLSRLASGPDGIDQGRATIVLGDITVAGLGIGADAAAALMPDLVAAFHLAAVYDLSVTAAFAERVNVQGTRHMIEFARGAPRFARFHHISTAYVSGDFEGVFGEGDLKRGQGFKNHYERTKYESEVDVVESRLPFTVYRPGVVVGHSETGETAKFDGPYNVLTAMERVPFVFIDGPKDAIVNIVPVDYVIEGIARLSAFRPGAGLTYNLTDPEPPTVRRITRVFAKALGRRYWYVPAPMGLLRAALHAKPLARALSLSPEAVDYFAHRCRYDATNARRDLASLGLTCPPIEAYVDRLVAFYRAHRHEVRRTAMV
jgi:nucleoside-diphosphate-sugar epimerase